MQMIFRGRWVPGIDMLLLSVYEQGEVAYG